MKIITSTSTLLQQLAPIARIAATRSGNPSLAGVRFAVTSDTVELQATDTDLSVRVPLAAEIEREGNVLLPAKLLLEIVRALPKQAQSVELELRPEQEDVEVRGGAATFDLRTLRIEDFPQLPVAGGDTVVDVPAAPFLETIQIVARSASRDETRPILTSVLVSASGQALRMVATDSYRLAVKETALESGLQGAFEANVPARALEELRAMSSGEVPERIRVGVRANQIVFELGDAVLASRLIDGQFPNFQQLLPDSFEHELRISAEELRDVVRRIGLLAQKNSPLRLSLSEGRMTVSAQTPDIGEASEPLAVPFSGEPFDIGFNPEFLRAGLESVGDGDLIFKFLTPLRPGLICGPEGSGFQYLIMPIRLNQ